MHFIQDIRGGPWLPRPLYKFTLFSVQGQPALPVPGQLTVPKLKESNQPTVRVLAQPVGQRFVRPAGGKTIEIIVRVPSSSEEAREVGQTTADGSNHPGAQVSPPCKAGWRRCDVHHRIVALQEQKRKLAQAACHLRRKNAALQKNLTRFLTPNQVEMLERNSTRGQRWTEDTIIRAVRLHTSCGTSGYSELLEQNYPLPSVATLRRYLQASDSSLETVAHCQTVNNRNA